MSRPSDFEEDSKATGSHEDKEQVKIAKWLLKHMGPSPVIFPFPPAPTTPQTYQMKSGFHGHPQIM